MNKTMPLLVMFLMIAPGLVGAMVPMTGPQGHMKAVTTVVDHGSGFAPMTWNGSDSNKWDAMNYEISVAMNPIIGNITATAKITIKALKNIVAANFTLYGALKVKWVKDMTNTALVYKQNSSLHSLQINFTGALVPGTVASMLVNYSGAVNKSISGDDNCNWTAGGLLKRDTPWFPQPPFTYSNLVDYIRPSDMDRYNLTVHALVPGNWTALSIGKYVGVVTQGPNKNYTYQSIDMVAGATLAAGDYQVNTTTHTGITISTYLFKANATQSGRFITREIAILDWFAAKYGIYPYSTLNMIEVNRKLGGLEGDQAMMVTDSFGSAIPPMSLVTATADQYLYFATCPIDKYDMFLSWSMSTYATTYFQLSVDGKNDLLKMHHFVYGGGTGELSIKDVTTGHNKFEAVIFHKGTYVLHMLRYLIGNSTFDGIMQAYVALAHGKNSTITDFMTAVTQKTAGTDLIWFFDQWLNSTQALDYSVTSQPSTMYQDGDTMKVEFTTTKVGGAAMPVDFAINYVSGAPKTVLPKSLCRTCSSKTFAVNITEDVLAVVVDPDLWLLDVNKDNDQSTPIKQDLVVEKFTADPDTDIIEGEKVMLKATVKNSGNDAQAFVLSFYTNGTLIPSSSKSVANLNPGAKTDVSYEWTTFKGYWNVTAVADSDTVIKEYNETNNVMNLTLDVAEYVPPPDLKYIGEMGFSKSKVTEGDYVQINVTIMNDYKRTLVGIYVDFRVDGTLLTTVTLGPVPANGTTNATANWPSVAGSHQIKANLHAPPGVSESMTSNNEISGSININDIPDPKLDVDNSNPFSGEEIEFSGSGSTDNVGIATYKFNFGDGTGKNWSESPKALHIYKFPGDYKATLMVRDNWGIESPWSDPLTVIVKNTQPTADFDVSAETGTIYTVFSFTPKAKDPDGNITTYYWDFGDSKSTNEKSPIHQYIKAGSFEVRLTVTDNSGQNSVPASKTITIKNLKPNALGSVSLTEVNTTDPVVVDASTSWDPDNDKGDLKFKWTADGTLISSKMKDTVTFSKVGNVHITLTVTDPAGATNTTEFLLKVKQKPGGGGGGDEPTNNNMIYYAAGAGGAIVAILLVYFLFMRGKKGKEVEVKPVPKAKGKAVKPEAKPTKPVKKEVEDEEAEAPEAPAKPVEAPKPAPKPKAVKKPAPKPAEKPVDKPKEPAKKTTVKEKAKQAAEDEWEK